MVAVWGMANILCLKSGFKNATAERGIDIAMLVQAGMWPGMESNHRHEDLQSSVRERGAGPRSGAAGLATRSQMLWRRTILEHLAQLLAQLWRIAVMMYGNRMLNCGSQ
jgi:hypothetical protein